MTAGFGLEGLQGALVAHVGYAHERGKPYAVLVLAAAEAFPEGALDGAAFHWGVASREGGAWGPPPEGWQGDPARSVEAGAFLPTGSCYVHLIASLMNHDMVVIVMWPLPRQGLWCCPVRCLQAAYGGKFAPSGLFKDSAENPMRYSVAVYALGRQAAPRGRRPSRAWRRRGTSGARTWRWRR